MLIKSKDVIGLKVLTLENGEKIDDIKDVIYDPEKNKVVALLVDNKGWFKDAKVLLIEDIKSIGHDNVMIQSQFVLKNASDVENRVASIARHDTYLTNTKIVTENGNDLGQVTDIIFDSENGQVKEFEVTQGALNDLKSGRKTVRIEDIITVGKDATIVRGYMESDFGDQAQHQGIQGVINQTGGKIKDTAVDVKEKIQHLPEDERVKDTLGKVKEQAGHLKDTVTSTVEDVKTKMQDAKTDPNNQQKVNDVKDKVSEFGSKVKDTFTHTKEDITSKVSDLKDNTQKQISNTQDAMKDKKMNDATGQYLTKDIISKKDEFIGRKGSLVTHALLSKAENEGLLDQVYSNLTKENHSLNTGSVHNTTTTPSKLKVEGEIDLTK